MCLSLGSGESHVKRQGLISSAMGFSMSYGPAIDSESHQTLAKAVSLGCTFWDSAAIYGKGHNESLIGDFVRQNPGSREKLFIASKCGIELETFTTVNSKEHIEKYIDESIERLGFKPDLYYIHRIEPGRDLKESIGALQAVKESGKARYIGLSECNATTLREACKSELDPPSHLRRGRSSTDMQSPISMRFRSSIRHGIQTTSRTG